MSKPRPTLGTVYWVALGFGLSDFSRQHLSLAAHAVVGVLLSLYVSVVFAWYLWRVYGEWERLRGRFGSTL